MQLSSFLVFLALFLTATDPWWSLQSTGVDSNLRGVSVTVPDASGNAIVWASGSNGVILRSTDSGKHWESLRIAGAEALDFRGVRAFGEKTAYVMSSGEGNRSRIYKTSDGGRSWQLQYSGKDKAFFLDGLVCSSETRCFALSDPVDGKFVMLQTEDGIHWTELPRGGMPAALAGEGAFAASNSSLILCGPEDIYFATGGSAARVFHSPDLGRTWTVSETPMGKGKASAGIFSIAGAGPDLLVVGGDYADPARSDRTAAYSHDQGRTWELATVMPRGYRSAVAKFVGGYVTVGPNGTEISRDGKVWQRTDETGFNAVAFEGHQGWAVGPKGIVAHFQDRTQSLVWLLY